MAFNRTAAHFLRAFQQLENNNQQPTEKLPATATAGSSGGSTAPRVEHPTNALTSGELKKTKGKSNAAAATKGTSALVASNAQFQLLYQLEQKRVARAEEENRALRERIQKLTTAADDERIRLLVADRTRRKLTQLRAIAKRTIGGLEATMREFSHFVDDVDEAIGAEVEREGAIAVDRGRDLMGPPAATTWEPIKFQPKLKRIAESPILPSSSQECWREENEEPVEKGIDGAHFEPQKLPNSEECVCEPRPSTPTASSTTPGCRDFDGNPTSVGPSGETQQPQEEGLEEQQKESDSEKAAAVVGSEVVANETYTVVAAPLSTALQEMPKLPQSQKAPPFFFSPLATITPFVDGGRQLPPASAAANAANKMTRLNALHLGERESPLSFLTDDEGSADGGRRRIRSPQFHSTPINTARCGGAGSSSSAAGKTVTTSQSEKPKTDERSSVGSDRNASPEDNTASITVIENPQLQSAAFDAQQTPFKLPPELFSTTSTSSSSDLQKRKRHSPSAELEQHLPFSRTTQNSPFPLSPGASRQRVKRRPLVPKPLLPPEDRPGKCIQLKIKKRQLQQPLPMAAPEPRETETETETEMENRSSTEVVGCSRAVSRATNVSGDDTTGGGDTARQRRNAANKIVCYKLPRLNTKMRREE